MDRERREWVLSCRRAVLPVPVTEPIQSTNQPSRSQGREGAGWERRACDGDGDGDGGGGARVGGG